MPIDPSMAVGGAEWQIAPLEPPAAGRRRDRQRHRLRRHARRARSSRSPRRRTRPRRGAQALAAGTAEDPTAVVMAVERAQLSMQLASQIRTKVVEAAQDIFHTQV